MPDGTAASSIPIGQSNLVFLNWKPPSQRDPHITGVAQGKYDMLDLIDSLMGF